MWIVDVPGKKPESGNPPWVRLRRLPDGTPESDVLELLKETAMVHRCARAVRGGVEIAVYGSRYSICRQLSVMAQGAGDRGRREDGKPANKAGP